MLSASLLGSTQIQKQLAQASTVGSLAEETQNLLSASQNHAQENAYRLALGVTAFPFEDPSAEKSDRRLLGVRFDIPDREGRYDKPYYILAQRLADNNEDLRIYRHTIPAFVPIREYESMYLSPQDEGYGSGEGTHSDRSTQDFHGLIKHVRHDLVSWTLRCEAIETLQQQLHLSSHSLQKSEEEDSHGDQLVGMFGIKALTPTAVEALQIKIEWINGAVGRVRFSEKGMIEKAVILDHHGRVREAEMILTRTPCSILGLATRLEAIHALWEEQENEGMNTSMLESEDRASEGNS